LIGAEVYALLSLVCLRLWYGRTGRVHLGDVFLVLDLLVAGIALVLTGGEQSLLFGLLFLRVADQAYISSARCARFLQLSAIVTVLAFLATGQVEGRQVDWQRGVAVVLMSYGAGLYILITARIVASVRRKLSAAVHTARAAVRAETERRGELERALLDAEEANRARQEFVSNVSHEIRTPLAGVIGATDLALSHALKPEVEELLQTSRLSARNLLFLLNDLLDLSKMDAGRFQLEPVPCELEAELANIVRAIHPAAIESGIELHVLLDGTLPEQVVLDPLRLGQILTNLLSNGIKFTPQGAVTLEVARIDEGLQFRVRDTGRGIERSQLERIFERFVQADGTSARREGGTGLGLSIVKQLVDRMGGRIEVSSIEGSGSCFEVTLPVALEAEATPSLEGQRIAILGGEETEQAACKTALRRAGASVVPFSEARCVLALDADAGETVADWEDGPLVAVVGAAGVEFPEHVARLRAPLFPRELLTVIRRAECAGTPLPPLSKPVRLAGCRVLVADDNRVNRRIARAHLERWGCEVTEAADGHEACVHVEEQAHDAILMDVQMPFLDGIAATQIIRNEAVKRRSKRVPIVALTANASRDDRDACLAAGMDAHMTKPIDFDKLAELLGELLGRDDASAA
ncbi:MAG: ATP-binding protein, partial [Planctomycetota bacterium]